MAQKAQAVPRGRSNKRMHATAGTKAVTSQQRSAAARAARRYVSFTMLKLVSSSLPAVAALFVGCSHANIKPMKTPASPMKR